MPYIALLVFLLLSQSAAAQSLEAGIHITTAQWSEFDGTDIGIGGRVTWKPASLIGVDADLAWYPTEFPPDTLPFSGSRVEGLFGVTIGPDLLVNRRGYNFLRPFVKVGGGFLKVSPAPEPFACIAVFPPPLACLMAAGQTLPVIDIGGGLEIRPTDIAFFRIDVSDRMLQYPGPSFGSNFERMDDAFYGHALRLTIGVGLTLK